MRREKCVKCDHNKILDIAYKMFPKIHPVIVGTFCSEYGKIDRYRDILLTTVPHARIPSVQLKANPQYNPN